jgi:putative acyl-CoA dehydrogenase
MNRIRSNRMGKRLFTSHEVFNQSRPFVNVDLLQSDVPLISSLKSMSGGHDVNMDLLSSFGKASGAAEIMEASDLAEKNRPTLKQFDPFGRRVDIAEYHPTYHQLMSHGLSHGCAGYGFRVAKPGSQLTRAALIYMENQLEAGHCCPIVMTAAGIPVLQKVAGINPWLKQFVEKIYAQKYDSRNVPIDQKEGVTLGMSMTEKQGGSDVRANTTLATPVEVGKVGIGAAYTLVGHKVSHFFLTKFNQLLDQTHYISHHIVVVHLCSNV